MPTLRDTAAKKCRVAKLKQPVYTSSKRIHDTLIVGNGVAHVEELARAVERAGSNYGMKLHWGKTQALSIGTSSRIRRPDGTTIEDTGSLLYLGGLLTAELSKRLGLASGDFQRLQRVRDRNVSRQPV